MKNVGYLFLFAGFLLTSSYVEAKKRMKGDGMVAQNHLGIREVKAEALKDEMANNPNLVVINVLAKEYFNDAHITGSINKSLDNLDELLNEYSENTPLVVYCASYQCSASRDAYKKLVEMGFTNVRAYEGGMKEWLAKGFSHEGPAAKDYLKK
ncbi:MAG: rhodanese-like domain-containing protein [Epsilonproteobacteria bacterium]|nr:rhodanese-like domain-containing protein [Campylobacterota bacterium]